MTNAQLLRALISALRAAADELERGAISSVRERPRTASDDIEITELDQTRADRVLAELGMR